MGGTVCVMILIRLFYRGLDVDCGSSLGSIRGVTPFHVEVVEHREDCSPPRWRVSLCGASRRIRP